MSFPASREPRMLQFLTWMADERGVLRPTFEWRDERFKELDELIALERTREYRQRETPRVCAIEGCGRPVRASGTCWRHYGARGDKGASGELLAPSPSGECALPFVEPSIR